MAKCYCNKCKKERERAQCDGRCHRTSKARGLLHGACNTAIGLLGEDPVTIEFAAAYVKSFDKTED